MDNHGLTLEEAIQKAKQLARDGHIQEAGRYLRSLAEKVPESSEVQFLLGACYAKIGRTDLARRCWEQSVELAPGNEEARAWLLRIRNEDPTSFEFQEGGSEAISGDLDTCWDPTA